MAAQKPCSSHNEELGTCIKPTTVCTSAAVSAVIALGYSKNVTERATELLLNRQKEITTGALLDAIAGFDDTQNGQFMDDEDNGTASITGNCSNALDQEYAEMAALEEENNRLRASTRCKVCLDATKVMMLFIPCSHIVCCEECSIRLEKCPLCRSSVYNALKTYIG